MSEAFDPYLHWLGIRDPQRPPNYYRLLGIELFENDPDIIAGAADRQMAHIRSFQSGPRSAESQRLLNELATAKLCLLNPAKKESYDATLQAEGCSAAPSGLLGGFAQPLAQIPGVVGKLAPPPPPAVRSELSPLPPTKYPVVLLAIVVIAAMVVVLGALVLFVVGGKGGPEGPMAGSGPDKAGNGSKLSAEGPENPAKTPPEVETVPRGGVKPDSVAKPDSTPQPPAAVKADERSKPVHAKSEMGSPTSPEAKAGPKPAVESGKTPSGDEKESEPDPRKLPPAAESMAAARNAMKMRDVAAAQRDMRWADKAAFPEDRKSVDQLREVLDPWVAFWQAVGEGLGELKPGDGVIVAGQAGTVVQASKDAVLLSVNGAEKPYKPATLPPDLLLKLANRKLGNSPMATCAKAAFLVMDAGGSPKRAEEFCREAAAQGMPVEGLLAEVKRSLTTGPAAPAPGKTAVPGAAAQETQRKTIREVLRDEYVKATTAAKKADLAGVLIRQGIETKDNPTVRYVLFAEARDMAVAAGNADLLRTAAEEMAKSYAVNPLEERGRALVQAAEGHFPAPVRKELGQAALALAEEAREKDDYDLAARLAKAAKTMASKSTDRATLHMAGDVRSAPALAEIPIRIGAKGGESACPGPGECQGERRSGDLQSADRE